MGRVGQQIPAHGRSRPQRSRLPRCSPCLAGLRPPGHPPPTTPTPFYPMTTFQLWLAGFCSGVAFTGALVSRLRLRMGPPKGRRGHRQPAPGTQRVYYDMPSIIAECGGPCTFGGPEFCDCGQLWRDVPVRLDEGPIQPGPQPPSSAGPL